MPFLVLYLGAAVSGWIMYCLSPNSNQFAIGTSGAISGLIAVYLILFPNAKLLSAIYIIWFVKFFYIRAWIYILPWVLIQIWSANYDADSSVAYSAHLGRNIYGVCFGLAYLLFKKISHKRGIML